MNKQKIKKSLFIVMVIFFLLVFVTGIIKFPGLLGYFGLRRANLPFYEISKIHDWSGIVLGILIIIHLILHKQWISSFLK